MSEKKSADPYAAMLATLEAQRAKIDAVIAGLKALQGSGTPIASAGFPNPEAGEPEIALDAFHRLTVSKAIKKYLGMRGKPATTPEIVQALIAGGQSGAEGANFMVVVNNTLNRMQAPDGGISKVKRGVWGLTEWYDAKPKRAAHED